MAATLNQAFLILVFLILAVLISAFLILVLAVFIPVVLVSALLDLALLILPTLRNLVVLSVLCPISLARGRTWSEPLEIVADSTFKRIRRLLWASLRNETISLLFDFRQSVRLREGDRPVFWGTERRRAS